MTDVDSTPAAVPPLVEQGPTAAPPALGVGLFAASVLPLMLLNAWGQHSVSWLVFSLLLGVGFVQLVRRKTRMLGQLTAGNPGLSMGLLLACWLLLALAIILVSPGLGAAAAVFTVLAAAYAWGGGSLVWNVLPAWLLLWFAIPLPFGYDVLVHETLWDWVVRAGSEVADLLGIHHWVQGRLLRFADRSFSLEPVLRGPLSMPLVLAITLFGLLFFRCSRLRTLVIVILAIFWGLMGNIAWVVAASYAERFQKLDMNVGRNALLLSVAILLLTLLLILSTDTLYRVLAIPMSIARFRIARTIWQFRVQRIQMAQMKAGQDELEEEDLPLPPVHPLFTDPDEEQVVVPEPTRLPALSQARFLSWPVVGAFAALALVQWFWVGPCLTALMGGGRGVRAAIEPRLTAESMPEKVQFWDRQSFDAHTLATGPESRDWTYKVGQAQALVSVEYPMRGRQDLIQRYQDQGWHPTYRQINDQEDGPVVESVFRQGPGRVGYLVYRQFGTDQRLIARPDVPVKPGFGGWMSELPRRLGFWTARTQAEQRIPYQSGYLVAVFVESSDPLSDEGRKSVQQLLDTAIRQVQGDGEKKRVEASS